MSGLSPISGFQPMPLPGASGSAPLRAPVGPLTGDPGGLGGVKNPAGSDFGELLGNIVETVQNKQAAAQDATRAVLAGDSDRIHQSMIAMQESSVAFSLMVEVRNRLVESYQELMRMPV